MGVPAVAVGTLVTRSHLAFARVLRRSLAAFHPGLRCHVLVVDGSPAVDGAEPGSDTLGLADLDLPDATSFAFRHTRVSAVCAVKPWLLRWLLRRREHALYLDADMFVLADLDALLGELARRPLLLTHHLLGPLTGPDAAARELRILRAGTFNAGLLGVSRSATAEAFLDWWSDRLAGHCRLDIAAGLHYDQRWLDLVPSFFADAAACRDPGVNVAHWNLHERPLRLEGERLLAGRAPCRLFHFSGFDPRCPALLTRHALDPDVGDAAVLAALRARYAALLDAAGHPELRDEAYGHGAFDNGVPIPDVARQLHAALGEAAAAFGNPFETAPAGSFWRWLLAPAGPRADGEPPVSRLWEGVHRSRTDLRRAFPSPLGADRGAFLGWARTHGVREHGVAPELAALP
jgi:hypothetical protein